MRLRHRLREAFKRFSKNGKVGTSKDYGIDWNAILENLGPCPGNLKDYHIDHIRPLSLFDFDNPEQVKQAFAPNNHQWLRKEENLKKHNKIIYMCTKCKQSFNFNYFYKNKGKKNGINSWCKECCKNYKKEYKRKQELKKIEKPKKNAKEYWKEYYKKNKEKIKIRDSKRKDYFKNRRKK